MILFLLRVLLLVTASQQHVLLDVEIERPLDPAHVQILVAPHATTSDILEAVCVIHADREECARTNAALVSRHVALKRSEVAQLQRAAASGVALHARVLGVCQACMRDAFPPRGVVPSEDVWRAHAALDAELRSVNTWPTLPPAQLAYRADSTVGRFPLVECRCYSQNTEDGILLHILSTIGVDTEERVAVELGSGVGWESNTASLCLFLGFRCLLVDGNPANGEAARVFFDAAAPRMRHAPRLETAWINAENVNDLVRSAMGSSATLDVLSIDLDGVDWWVWRALDDAVARPRVVVVEIQELWGADIAATRPYDPAFVHSGFHTMGASLAAYVRLGRAKGYRLVGCIREGFNAFFVRNDLGQHAFPAVDAASCLHHHRTRAATARQMARRRELAKEVPWLAVSDEGEAVVQREL